MSKLSNALNALKPATDENDSPVLQQEYDQLKAAAARWEFIKRFFIEGEAEKSKDEFVPAFFFREDVYLSKYPGETLDDVIDAAIAKYK